MPRSVSTSPLRPYHHGNLRQALMAATLDLARSTGLEQVSLREVARRVGVSSGAPFRHFRDKRALMTALAEEATRQLRIIVERDQQTCTPAALARLRALGHSFLDWALRHPVQFRLVSQRDLFDFDASPGLQAHFDAVRALTVTLIEAAQREGTLPAGPAAASLALTLRASAYGLARMAVDGQLPQWGVDPNEASGVEATHAALDLLIDALRPRPDRLD